MDHSQALVEAVVAASREMQGRRVLSCAEAFRLADEHHAKHTEIGTICNEQNVRICACQLGCFK